VSGRPPAPPLHLAFLGTGAAARLHSRTLSRLSERVLRSYASRDAARAEALRRQHGGCRSYGSYAAALSDPEVDAVLVVTPPASHLELTLEALRAGKHVIVEKPAFLRASDVDLVRERAAAAGGQVMVAENYFYKPLAKRLREVVRAGLVGDVLFVHVNALKRQDVGGWREDPAHAGGGALYEGGIHWVNLMANLGLTVRAVRAHRAGGSAALEKSVLVTFDYDGGAVGTLLYSWEAPSLFRGLRLSRLFGTRGSVTFESNGLFLLVHGPRRRYCLPGLRDIAGYQAMFADFLQALRRGEEPQMTLAHAERDLALVEQAYRAGGQP